MQKTESDYLDEIFLIREKIFYYEDQIAKGNTVAVARQRFYLDDLSMVFRNYYAWCRKHGITPSI